MVKITTRTEVKLLIKEFIEQQNKPFKTKDVIEFSRKETSKRISLSPNRITNFIRSTNLAKFDKKKKEWFVKLTPSMKLKLSGTTKS